MNREEMQEKYPDVKFGMTENMTMINLTDSPDELLGTIALMLHHAVKTVVMYEDKMMADGVINSVMGRSKIMDVVMDMANAHNLVDAGMDPDEAMDVMGHKKGTYTVKQPLREKE